MFGALAPYISDDRSILFVDLLVGCAAASIFASLFVVSTLFLFRRLRNMFFMRLIAFISLSDLLGNIPYLFPYRPPTGNWWCGISAFLNLAAYPSSWFWTVYLNYCLFSLGRGKFATPNMTFIHSICWGVPVALALSNLTVSKYANSGNVEVCVVDRNRVSDLYHMITYYGLLTLCLLIMVLFILYLFSLRKQRQVSVSSRGYQLAVKTLGLYPFALFLFWMPHLLTYALISFHYHSNDFIDAYYFCTAWKVLHGLCTACIFFYNSPEARCLWYRFFCFAITAEDVSISVSVDHSNDDYQAAEFDRALLTTGFIGDESFNKRESSALQEDDARASEVLQIIVYW